MTTKQLSSLEGCVRPADMARRLGVDRTTLDDWRKRRGLPSFKVGGRRYFNIAAVDEWVRQQQEAAQ